ncbi:MAG TPA: cytochrome c oxidase assembly protein [Gammaproteobacteria bacterium]|jgi:cytochrome c oxidase assembly protein subunit 11|nr:cytochrome c oxidase assembly protein [Gammaproteobacteria bacterium]
MTAAASDNDRHLPWKLLVLVAAMFGFGFALVPLYSVFCTITGFGGKPANSAAAPLVAAADLNRTVRVEFLASVARGAPFDFAPEQSHVEVHPGETYVAKFAARNRRDEPVVAQAVPSISPGEAARYFKKFECFCFTTQPFDANEARELTVAFTLDPKLPAELDAVSLSYTFYDVSKVGTAE